METLNVTFDDGTQQVIINMKNDGDSTRVKIEFEPEIPAGQHEVSTAESMASQYINLLTE